MRSLMLCLYAIAWLACFSVTASASEEGSDFLRQRLSEVRERYLVAPANVQDVQVIVSKTVPPEAIAQTRIIFPDACTEVGDVEETFESGVFTVRIQMISQRQAVCAQMQRIFSYNHPLITDGMSPGVYRVEVHGHTATFVLP